MRELSSHPTSIPGGTVRIAVILAALLLAGAGLLLGAAAARGATFTVGPARSYDTIQAAIAAAIASGEDSEVRVQSGTYREHLTIDHPPAALSLLGGYGADFRAEGRSASATTIVDAAASGRPLTLACDHAGVVVEGVSLVNGFITYSTAWAEGGGLMASVLGSCGLELRNLVVSGNQLVGDDHLSGGGAARGGGASLHLHGDAHLVMENVRIERNEVAAATHADSLLGLVYLYGAGLALDVAGNADARVRAISVAYNVAAGSDMVVDGAGADLTLGSSTPPSRARLSLVDSSFVGNRVASTRRLGSQGAAGARVTTLSCSDCTVEMRRNEFRANSCSPRGREGGNGWQLALFAEDPSTVEVSDTLITDGDRCGGVAAVWIGFPPPAGFRLTKFRLTSLTVANHRSAPGIFLGVEVFDLEPPHPVIALANTIAFGNGEGNLLVQREEAVTVAPSNLFGIDPLFADPELGDYHLLPGSPALNRGDDLPAGGLGPQDLDRTARIKGPHVDLGAYEAPISDSLCHVSDLGLRGTIPRVPGFAPVCRCLRDTTLRTLGCGFFLPELFVHARIPLPLPAGGSAPTDWAIDPWLTGAGPYQLSFETLQKGQWVPAGPTLTGKLEPGKLASGQVSIAAPAVSSPLRARIRHQVPGLDKPVEDVIEMLLEVGKPQ